jgi:LEA14-like dessication related protein
MKASFQRYSTTFALLVFTLTLNGCSAVLQEVLKEPEVSVGEFKLVKAGLINQTFSLKLVVTNPNQIALPIKSFNYNIQLAGDEFASGNTTQPFSIPAKGSESIDLTVKLNLLRSSSHLINIVKSGSKTINYQLNGNIGIDLPLMAAVPVSKVGSLKLSR